MVEEYLEELKNGNELNDCVLDYYIDRKYSNTDELIRELEDLQRYGCVSGMIADLIYYDDTIKFYDNYKDDINELLSGLLDGSGLSIQEFFGKNFDNDDPLILNFSNTNLLGGAEESYGTSWTVAAMIAQTSGVPLKLKVDDYDSNSTKFSNIVTLGDILKDNGYNNYLMIGSDSEFGGRKAYFSTHGYEISDYYTAIKEGKISSDYYNGGVMKIRSYLLMLKRS